MVLRLFQLLAMLGLVLLVMMARPGYAHEHNEQQEAAEQAAHQAEAASPAGMAEMEEHHHHHDGDMEEARPTTFSGRLAAWLGNMHPFVVHFPIALIPASWLALWIARRRGHAVDALRALIMLAGVAAVAAALLGWLNAGFALTDPNPIRTAHRWIGTSLAILVGVIGIWAWRRREAVDSRLMVWALGATTLILLVQGWLGAVLTHGIGHMMF